MYKENTRYLEHLKQRNAYGNSNVRYIEFEDTNDNILIWITNDYNKCIKRMTRRGLYSFTVKFIGSNNNVYISHLRYIK